jgi:hypothetical protein
MNLVKERNSWRTEFETGVKPPWQPYEEYVENRESEYWRSSRISERFHEYVMWLEESKCK